MPGHSAGHLAAQIRAFLAAQNERLFLIAQIGAARAAVITYVNPAVAALLGVLALHESFGLGSALGLALILGGSWLATQRRHPEPRHVVSQ